MHRLYMDNAATSFPKPAVVHDAMMHYATKLGASAGRGAYAEARETGQIIEQCRDRIKRLIGAADADHIIMTFNCTDGLSLALHGLLGGGGHVITTAMDHNSVLRPLNELNTRTGLAFDVVPADSRGLVDPDDIRKAIRPDTAVIAVVHGSNVTGSVQPIAEVGRIARERDIVTVVDAAQTVGHWPIDVQHMQIDLLAAPGHKGALGPLGTGFLYIRNGLERHLRTLKQGGTGSRSEQAVQPDDLPDKYEPGSHNAIGIAGLNAGVGWILDRSVESLRDHDRGLGRRFIDGLAEIKTGLTWYGPRDAADRIGVFSIRVDGYDSQNLSGALEQQFDVLTRSGLHCAPLAHRTIGTLDDGGTTRLSFGPFITFADIDHTLNALGRLARTRTSCPVSY